MDEQDHSVEAGKELAGATTESPRPALVDGILIHTVTFQVCDPCLNLVGAECHTPSCVFCFRSTEEARRVLDVTLVCPIVNGERMILAESRFLCPRCGSSHFGSTQNADESLTRVCHGCKTFSWHQSEDAKYFAAR